MGRLGSSGILQRSKALALQAMHFFLDLPVEAPGQDLTLGLLRTVTELVAALREADMAESDEEFRTSMTQAHWAARGALGALSMLPGVQLVQAQALEPMRVSAAQLRDNCEQLPAGAGGSGPR
ncbi:MAG: hypothetical protein ACYS5V_12500 [Planctomycetota bacterium]|jgi:hypothetical protein